MILFIFENDKVAMTWLNKTLFFFIKKKGKNTVTKRSLFTVKALQLKLSTFINWLWSIKMKYPNIF